MTTKIIIVLITNTNPLAQVILETIPEIISTTILTVIGGIIEKYQTPRYSELSENW